VTNEQIILIVCQVLAFIPAIVLHEVSHGAAAFALGDTTAKEEGRLTLNPLAHVDPFGTVLLPILLIAAGGPVFGYAKPVPYNPMNFKNKRTGDLIVGMAGPAANLVQALIGSALMFALAGVITPQSADFAYYFYYAFLPMFIMINLYLMFFNLLPIPPLDGSSIFAFFTPERHLPTYYRIQQYALPVFLVLLFALPYFIHVDLIGWYLKATAGNLGSLLIP